MAVLNDKCMNMMEEPAMKKPKYASQIIQQKDRIIARRDEKLKSLKQKTECLQDENKDIHR